MNPKKRRNGNMRRMETSHLISMMSDTSRVVTSITIITATPVRV